MLYTVSFIFCLCVRVSSSELFKTYENFWDVMSPQRVVPGFKSVVFVRKTPPTSEPFSAVLSIEDFYGKELFGQSWENQTINDEEDLNLDFLIPEYAFSQGLEGTIKFGCESEDCPIVSVNFKLASRIRQIELFTEKTAYYRGDVVNIFYSGLSENIHLEPSTRIQLWIQDPSEFKLYEWRGLLADREDYGRLSYPLGRKAGSGIWKICAHEEGEEFRSGSKNCVDFNVSSLDEEAPEYEATTLAAEKHYVDLFFGSDMRRSYRPGFPFTGRVMVSSSEKEVEISVRLLEVSENETKVLENETLLLKKEAIFDFPHVNSSSEQLILQAELISLSTDNKSYPLQNTVLASEVIKKEKSDDESSNCALRIGEGLDRTFKAGDVSTVEVLASCPCDELGVLHWIVEGRGQFLAWGKHSEKAPYLNGQCAHKISLSIVSRMAPGALLKTWTRAIDSNTTIQDSLSFSLTLEDLSLVILETNSSSLSHSRTRIGIEVFTEPNALLCIFGFSGSEDDEKNTSFDIIRNFNPGKYFWFSECNRASDDGFYTTSVLPPDPKYFSQYWRISSISISSAHGIRKSETKTIEKKKPLNVELIIPKYVRATEIFPSRLRIRSEMPLNMQITVIISVSTGKNELIFNDSGRHYDSFVANITKYGSLDILKAINVTQKAISGNVLEKLISAHITAVAVIDGSDNEIESLYVNKKIRILPQGNPIRKTKLRYFCANQETLKDLESNGDWKIRSLASLSKSEILFTVRSSREITLALTTSTEKFSKDDEEHLNDSNAFQVVIGAKKNTVSWIGTGIEDADYQLRTVKTPGILSPVRFKTFQASWEKGILRLSLLNSGNRSFESIVSWPIQAFKPNFIGIKSAGKESSESDPTDIRFWVENGERGFNQVFSLTNFNDSILNSLSIELLLSKGLILPTTNALRSPSKEKETLWRIIETFRDVVSMSKSAMTAEITPYLHEAMQDLLYYKNTQKSFGPDFVTNSFKTSVEFLFLLNEVKSFFHIDLNLIHELEKWIEDAIHSDDLGLERALDMAEYLPKNSPIFTVAEKKVKTILEKEYLLKSSSISKYRLAFGLWRMDSKFKTRILNDIPFRNLSCEEVGKREDITYLLLILSYLERNPLNNSASNKYFICIQSYINSLRRTTGYLGDRALSSYVYHDNFFPHDLKISLATSDLSTTSTLVINDLSWASNGSDFKRLSLPKENKILPTKLYLLATGFGCGSLQVTSEYSTYANNVDSSDPWKDYEVSLDMTEDEDLIYLHTCIRLKRENQSHATIKIEIFSGFKFVSASTIGKPKARWRTEVLQESILIHLESGSVDCGDCFTLKYRRIFTIKNLKPARITVYGRYSSPLPSQFFHATRNSSLLEGVSKAEIKSWFGTNENVQDNGGVTTSNNFISICPCSMRCQRMPKQKISSDKSPSETNTTLGSGTYIDDGSNSTVFRVASAT